MLDETILAVVLARFDFPQRLCEQIMHGARLLRGAHLHATTLVQVDVVGVYGAGRGQVNLRHATEILAGNVIAIVAATCTRLVQVVTRRCCCCGGCGGCLVSASFELLFGCGLFASTYATAYQRLYTKTEYASATRTPERRPARCTPIALRKFVLARTMNLPLPVHLFCISMIFS